MNALIVPLPALPAVWTAQNAKGVSLKIAVLVYGAIFDAKEHDTGPNVGYNTATGELQGDWLVILDSHGWMRKVPRDHVRVEIPKALKEKQAELALTEEPAKVRV